MRQQNAKEGKKIWKRRGLNVQNVVTECLPTRDFVHQVLHHHLHAPQQRVGYGLVEVASGGAASEVGGLVDLRKEREWVRKGRVGLVSQGRREKMCQKGRLGERDRGGKSEALQSKLMGCAKERRENRETGWRFLGSPATPVSGHAPDTACLAGSLSGSRAPILSASPF